MAREDTQVPNEEIQPDANQAPEQDQAQNVADDATDTASPTESQPDYEGRIKALEEQYRRAEERNRYLEQTARLLEEDRRRYSQQQQPQRSNDPGLPPELLELDKTLDPLFNQRLQKVTQPVVDTISRLYDEQDASRFEMYLMRNHPEIFDEDGGLDKVFQDVEAVRRQAAQNYNQWLSRVDAFLYAQGIQGVQQQAKSRKEKKSVQVREEAKRMQTVRAAGSGVQQTAPRKTASNELQTLRDKASRGRLTDAERNRYRDLVSEVTF